MKEEKESLQRQMLGRGNSRRVLHEGAQLESKRKKYVTNWRVQKQSQNCSKKMTMQKPFNWKQTLERSEVQESIKDWTTQVYS